MKIFRNPEVIRDVILYFIIAVLATAGTVFFVDWKCGGIVLGICLLCLVLHIGITYRRYQRISDLVWNLDTVLHGEAEELLQDCEEGELAILRSQLNKILLRLREQSDLLQEDKIFLADALADISHQMKTPLTSIHLVIDKLSEEEMSGSTRRRMARELTSLVDRIDWLVYALLRMSKLDAGTVTLRQEKVSVRELIAKAYEPLAIPMDIHGIIWECYVEDTISFRGDLEWSAEAVSNILKNCMEHTPKRGCISVYAEENAVYTQIIIRDSGDGIKAEDLPHLFERFYRGKRQDIGSVGIGLSLAQKIIQTQNGIIRAGNAKEGGAEFTIRFYKGVI